ncbi:MAG: carbamoyl-phosphate synthase large subunit [Chloroherpetonaceae bacterium]|nr:carbamoyl-phosphate synthase large subunit [Chloroherpetonaceae bacterium]
MQLTSIEEALSHKLTAEKLREAKENGFSDVQLANIFNAKPENIRALANYFGVKAVFKTIDTCAAEFDTTTPYYYSTYEEENESVSSEKKKVMILGGGPNRIGQGIEFDYCCVQAVFTLKKMGIETIMVNCNPETVSTDYDVSDKLYFEPLTFEDVMNIIEHEKPYGVIVSFGGQTPLRLSTALTKAGVRILGTSSEGIDVAEDREKFGVLLQKLKIPHPPYGTARNLDEAKAAAHSIGYPVLVRPSYVLGGRAMKIVYSEEALENYVAQALKVSDEHPLLIDRFLEHAVEYDIDVVSDGKDTVVSGIMQHIEVAGIHSGDSTSVLPPHNTPKKVIETMKTYTRKLAKALKVSGLMNVQYAVQAGKVYVLEVNPRASRTVPFVAKATGTPMIEIACRVMLGEKLQPLITKLKLKDCDELKLGHIAVKEPVFPFSKFLKSGVFLGPEMRSTGEVMGLGTSFGEAFTKAAFGAGNKLPTSGTVLVSLSDVDKNALTARLMAAYEKSGFEFMATSGTAAFLRQFDIDCKTVFKVGEGRPNVFDVIRMGKVQFVINTPLGERSRYDEEAIGTAAVLSGIAYATTIETAEAALAGIQELRKSSFRVKSLQDYLGYKKPKAISPKRNPSSKGVTKQKGAKNIKAR